MKTKLFWSVGLGLNLILIISLYLTKTIIGIDNFSDNISLPLFSIIPGSLILLGIWALTKNQKFEDISKKPLLLMVIAFGLWFAAEQTWNLYEHVLDIDPYPSIADLFYLAAPLVMFASLILFLKDKTNHITKKSVIVSIFVSTIVLIPSLLATYEVGEEDSFFEVVIALLYPIVDFVLLIPAIIAIKISVANKRSYFWSMVLFGILVLIAADTIFLFLIIDDAYVDGHPVDILFISSYFIWAFMMGYLVSNKNTNGEEVSKYKIRKIDKYGIVILMILINIVIGTLLLSMNFALTENTTKESTSYFSWILVMTVIIFSTIILVLNSKLNTILKKKSETLEKTSEELIKAERFSAIGTLASRLAHDLRNPLGIIVTSNSIIKSKSTDDKILKNSEYISRSVDRMEHQINNVLDFVRVQPLRIENISIQELVEESLKNIKIPKEIVIEKPKSNEIIQCDKTQFLIVIYNLIFNAIQKLETTGKIKIKLESNSNEHIIKIEDSGEAIPNELKEKIFEPLFTTKHQGTGLGLASCKQIIKEHKGTIDVENNPTTFVIKIPKEIKS